MTHIALAEALEGKTIDWLEHVQRRAVPGRIRGRVTVPTATAPAPFSHGTPMLGTFLVSYLVIVLDISIVVAALPKVEGCAGADRRRARIRS
jgi:hypothetical protein